MESSNPNPSTEESSKSSLSKDCRIIMNVYYNPVEPLRRLIESNRPLYVPVIGGASTNSYCTDDWCKNNLNRDDDGEDNISNLNHRYNELTSIYWYWKNRLYKDNPKYIGYNHYRRFFKKDELIDYDKYDILTTTPIPMQFLMNGYTEPVRCDIEFGYMLCHVMEDWYKMMSEVSKRKLSKIAYRWKRMHILPFPCNMFLMSKDFFHEYCEFMFDILNTLNSQIDTAGRDNYQKRALAFLSERLTSLWIYNKVVNTNVRVKIVNADFMKEWKDNELNERGTY